MSLITNKDEKVIAFFDSMNELLKALEDALAGNRPLLGGEHYLTDREVSELLKVGQRTLQDYRNQGVIPYIKLGGKILYKFSDLEKLLYDNYCRAWRE